MTCCVEGCDKPILVKSRGWCSAHYYRWKRNGDPLGGNIPTGERLEFIRRAIKNPGDECIIWPYSVSGGGYGLARYKGKITSAHRIALILHSGIDPGRDIHAAHGPCHNRLCINPNHLEWRTRADNNGPDKRRDGTSGIGSSNPMARLNDDSVRRIRASQSPHKAMADLYGVSPAAIRKVRSRKTWRHVS